VAAVVADGRIAGGGFPESKTLTNAVTDISSARTAIWRSNLEREEREERRGKKEGVIPPAAASSFCML
jgi:hypothetical protein